MCVVNKYANVVYLQKVYIVMSCLCDFTVPALTGERRTGETGGGVMIGGMLTSERT